MCSKRGQTATGESSSTLSSLVSSTEAEPYLSDESDNDPANELSVSDIGQSLKMWYQHV